MKKIMCILLSVILLLPMCVCVAGACECNTPPVVKVRGFGSALYMTLDDGTVKNAFSFESDRIMKAVPGIIKTLSALAITKDYDAAEKGLISILNSFMSDIRCDSNGESINDISALDSSPTDVDKHMKDSRYFAYIDNSEAREYVFEYDWRLDPVDVAQQLNEYIQQVKKVTGHDKVVLCAHSEGNNVAASYLTKYGVKDVEKTLLLSAACNGLKMVGQLFTRDVTLTGKIDQLEDFLLTFLGDEPAGALAAVVVSVLNDMGILDKVNDELVKLLDAKLQDMYDNYLIDMFATMPGIWSFVPDEYYESAKTAMFGSDSKYSELISKIDGYHYGVQCKVSDTLKDVKAKVPVCVVTGYGISPIPVYEGSDEQSDMLIDTKYTSFGATCAKVGQKLEKNDSKYLSSDLLVDASTCLFPDSTWFVKYQDHNTFCDPYCEFLTWLIQYDGQPTVFTNADYPQYMICHNHETLKPVTESDDMHGKTDIEILLAALIALIKQAFMAIKAKVPEFSK